MHLKVTANVNRRLIENSFSYLIDSTDSLNLKPNLNEFLFGGSIKRRSGHVCLHLHLKRWRRLIGQALEYFAADWVLGGGCISGFHEKVKGVRVIETSAAEKELVVNGYLIFRIRYFSLFFEFADAVFSLC